ncbi:MAG TPA: M20/M25/M40 family metallo-hydrolase, partial [Candidatus Omnitrophota bacterium]|nr:M20/M25/M40 family metallo-hydrolase [Candidatus Omnitrophota bacterium]
MIDIQRLVKLTQDLIRIDSRNPGGSERDIALFVKRYLETLGIKANLYEFKEGRTNVVARLRGRGSSQSLLITPHLDTVPPGKGWKMPPFTGRVSGGKIYGLGATDCKCNLAVSL